MVSDKAPASPAVQGRTLIGDAVVSDGDVLRQEFAFKPEWWRRYISAPWWPEGIDELPEDPARPGYRLISRQDVFGVAGDSTAHGRVRLLLAAYIWGTGPAAFLVGRRVRTFTRTDLADVEACLAAATDLMQSHGAVAAYDSLLARQSNHIKFMGPAFFTKYLYFAAGHPSTVMPQPLILDKFVALSLNRHFGWSLPTTGWPSTTYARYLDLAAEQAAEAGPHTSPAGIEMGWYLTRE